jgi:16S rRNA (adenine1518-N6/adenine1519-N6)-dimethyltransferase
MSLKNAHRRWKAPPLGQHFLRDAEYRTRIVSALPFSAADVVIEIGAGRGALTTLLAERARKVLAIEIDRALAEQLRQDFSSQARVEIVSADVLSVDLAALCRREGVAQAWVFGNLPYYITSPILHHLLAQRRSIRAMALLMQREVAERLTALPGTRDYGYLSVATQLFTEPHLAFAVPPGAFSPAPKVQSALVTFKLPARFENWAEEVCEEFLAFVKCAFARKRKNLLNNLGSAYARPAIVEALESANLPGSARAEQVSLDGLVALFKELHHSGGAMRGSTRQVVL